MKHVIRRKRFTLIEKEVIVLSFRVSGGYKREVATKKLADFDGSPKLHDLYKAFDDEHSRCKFVRALLKGVYCKQKGKTQKDLADDLRLTPPRVSQLKAGYYDRGGM